eukprot:UN15689
MLEQSGQVRAANILPHDVLIYPLNYLNLIVLCSRALKIINR